MYFHTRSNKILKYNNILWTRNLCVEEGNFKQRKKDIYSFLSDFEVHIAVISF